MLEVQFREPLARAFQKVPLGPKEEPGEDRVVVGRTSWEQYLAIDQERGPDNSRPRLYFLNEQVEMMNTSREHERFSECLSYMLMEYLFTTDLEIFPCGQATMIREKQASAEPDKSWCLDEEKEFPDIVLEVALTNGGLDRLAIYRYFPVPEVWFWRKKGLEIWHLKADASGYDGPARASRLLPGLDFDWVE